MKKLLLIALLTAAALSACTAPAPRLLLGAIHLGW